MITRPDGAVFSWLLTAHERQLGNHIAYGYRDGGTGGPQRYLQTVSYADYGDPSAPELRGHRHDRLRPPGARQRAARPRPDPFSDRRPGFELRTTLRASRISVTTLAGRARPPPATTVDLTYRDETADGPAASAGVAARPVIGHRPGTRRRPPQPLPPLTFTYRDWDPTARRYRPLSGLLPPVPLGGALDLVDLFADGLPSVIELDGAARYWRNRGDGAFEPARPLSRGSRRRGPRLTRRAAHRRRRRWPPRARGHRRRPDHGVVACVRADRRPRLGSIPGRVSTTAVPSVGYTEPQVRVVDLDGDHVVDLLVGGNPPMAATGDGQGGFRAAQPAAGRTCRR